MLVVDGSELHKLGSVGGGGRNCNGNNVTTKNSTLIHPLRGGQEGARCVSATQTTPRLEVSDIVEPMPFFCFHANWAGMKMKAGGGVAVVSHPEDDLPENCHSTTSFWVQRRFYGIVQHDSYARLAETKVGWRVKVARWGVVETRSPDISAVFLQLRTDAEQVRSVE